MKSAPHWNLVSTIRGGVELGRLFIGKTNSSEYKEHAPRTLLITKIDCLPLNNLGKCICRVISNKATTSFFIEGKSFKLYDERDFHELDKLPQITDEPIEDLI